MTKKIGHYLWMFPYDYDTGLGFMAVDLQKAGLKCFPSIFCSQFLRFNNCLFLQNAVKVFIKSNLLTLLSNFEVLKRTQLKLKNAILSRFRPHHIEATLLQPWGLKNRQVCIKIILKIFLRYALRFLWMSPSLPKEVLSLP